MGLLAATLRRWEDAAQHYEQALVIHARMGARPWLAYSQYAYAALLLDRGRAEDRGRAADFAAQAQSTALELGMPALTEQAQALQAQLAAAANQPAPAVYPDGLTAREVEVLGLLAAGTSNREIASQLVVSVRTVDHHVANIYRKIGARLGSHARVDAAAYAHRRGLLPPDTPAM